jgi:hypothetical protein
MPGTIEILEFGAIARDNAPFPRPSLFFVHCRDEVARMEV